MATDPGFGFDIDTPIGIVVLTLTEVAAGGLRDRRAPLLVPVPMLIGASRLNLI